MPIITFVSFSVIFCVLYILATYLLFFSILISSTLSFLIRGLIKTVVWDRYVGTAILFSTTASYLSICIFRHHYIFIYSKLNALSYLLLFFHFHLWIVVLFCSIPLIIYAYFISDYLYSKLYGESCLGGNHWISERKST